VADAAERQARAVALIALCFSRRIPTEQPASALASRLRSAPR